MICPKCKTENGMAMKLKKVCKKCGSNLIKIDKNLKKKIINEIIWNMSKPASEYHKDWLVIPALDVIKLIEEMK